MTETPSSVMTTVAQPFAPAPPRLVPPKLRLDPFGSLRRHRVVAISVFIVLFGATLPVAWWKGRPRFTSAAVVFVSPRFVANLEGNKEFELQSNSEYREYVQQNVRTINRFDIIEEAVESLGQNRSLWQKSGESITHATERLQHALAVAPVPDTYQIVVSLESDRPNGLALIVNSVVDTFLKKIRLEEFYGTDQRIENLRSDRAGLAKEIADKQAKRVQLAQQLGVSTFSESFPNPYDRLVVDARQAFSEATRQRIQTEAEVSALSGRSTSGNATPLEANVLDAVNRDPGLASLEASLNQRRGALLSALSGLSPDHPGRRAAERELKELEQERDKLFSKLLKGYATGLWEQRSSDLSKTRQAEDRLRAEAEKQASQAAWFTERYQAAITLGLDIERERKRLDSIDDRIGFLSLESRAPGFVRLFSRARQPDVPSKGGRRNLLLVCLGLSILAAVLAPVGIDLVDPRLHWPGDVHAILGFPVLGWLLEKDDAGDDFAREQILRLAARISQENHVHGSKVFAFTAVQAGNGTTTIVRELATALTRLGVPSLAVEANAYRSDAQYCHPSSRGLSVVLTGTSDVASEIVRGDEQQPDQLPVGDVHRLSHLPDLHNLISVLRQAADLYSLVLVDLPPLSASVDAELVARSADLVVLVIEAETVSKPRLSNTAVLLERLKPRAVAAVLNRVQLHAAAGFGKEARDEFYRGFPAGSALWRTPWLWR